MDNSKPDTTTNQRPFHICPACNAYNAKFNATCWRFSHDLAPDALSPSGVLGYRMSKLDAEAKGKAPKMD